MKNNSPSHAGEPAGAQAACGTSPPRRIHVIDDEIVNPVAPHRPLPCRADRQKIIQQANLVLAEARAIAAGFNPMSMQPPPLPSDETEWLAADSSSDRGNTQHTMKATSLLTAVPEECGSVKQSLHCAGQIQAIDRQALTASLRGQWEELSRNSLHSCKKENAFVERNQSPKSLVMNAL
jgi:hypothetical protein